MQSRAQRNGVCFPPVPERDLLSVRCGVWCPELGFIIWLRAVACRPFRRDFHECPFCATQDAPTAGGSGATTIQTPPPRGPAQLPRATHDVAGSPGPRCWVGSRHAQSVGPAVAAADVRRRRRRRRMQPPAPRVRPPSPQRRPPHIAPLDWGVPPRRATRGTARSLAMAGLARRGHPLGGRLGAAGSCLPPLCLWWLWARLCHWTHPGTHVERPVQGGGCVRVGQWESVLGSRAASRSSYGRSPSITSPLGLCQPTPVFPSPSCSPVPVHVQPLLAGLLPTRPSP